MSSIMTYKCFEPARFSRALHTIFLNISKYVKHVRAVPGKNVLGGGTELENGGTTNTILSLFMVQSIWIYQETPPPT